MRRRAHYNTASLIVAVLGVGVGGSFVLAPVADLAVGPSIATWFEPSSDDPELSPADVIALRFPDQWEETTIAGLDETTNTSELGSADNDDRLLFSPYPLFAQSTIQFESTPRIAAAAQPEKPAAPMRTAAVGRPVAPAPARPSGRPDAVFNDAQIATIKQRLRLTADQEYMWPAVEAALRKLSYPKGSHKGSVDVSRVAAIDPSAADVQNLSSAATPLVMSFSDDQRRELRVLAHVAGLDQLVPKF